MQQFPLLAICFLASLPTVSTYIQHSFTFPNIPYTAGVYHIHSPIHFMEAHGFTMPGFRVTQTCAPEWTGSYVVTEFNFTTHFGGPMNAKIFSGALDTCHVLVRDCDGEPCVLGRLRVQKFSAGGHVLSARGDLLRPANVWERLIGGQRLVKREGVERAVKLGYSSFKNDMNLVLYVNLILASAKNGQI